MLRLAGASSVMMGVVTVVVVVTVAVVTTVVVLELVEVVVVEVVVPSVAPLAVATLLLLVLPMVAQLPPVSTQLPSHCAFVATDTDPLLFTTKASETSDPVHVLGS